jgi:hypothetical protein
MGLGLGQVHLNRGEGTDESGRVVLERPGRGSQYDLEPLSRRWVGCVYFNK